MLRPFGPRRLLLFSLCSSSSSSSITARPCVVRISHFSSSSNYHSHGPSFSRRHEEESRNVRVSVWWDFENCHLPIGVNVFKVATTITAALRANGIKGPIQITAFGDVLQLSRANQEALSSTGINLNHIPNGGKNSADRSLLVDLMFWVCQNPPPAHLFLISGDRDFAGVLHHLRMNNYNILLASIDSAPDVLCSAASIMWHWNSLVRGESLIGKHFNYPPDGSYGSWYGHFKAPIEELFSASKQPISLKTEGVSKPIPDSKVCPPKSLLKQIKLILKSHPQGISINDLRSELLMVDRNLDKEYYGHRKFSRFLLSLPNILQIQTGADGQFVVRSVSHKSPEPFEPSAIPSVTSDVCNRAGESIAPPKLGVESTDTNYDENGKSNSKKQRKEPLNETLTPISHRESLTEASTLRKTSQPQVLETRVADLPPKIDSLHSPNEKVVEVSIVQETESPSPKTQQNMMTVENQIPKTVVGFFKRMWRKLFPEDHFFKSKMDKSLKNISSSEGQNATDKNSLIDDRLQMARPEDNKYTNSTIDGADQGCQFTHFSTGCNPELKLKSSETTKSYQDSSSGHQGIYDRVVYWWQSRRIGKVLEHSSTHDKNEVNLTRNKFEKHKLFIDSSFWSDVEAFLGTIKGSDVISQSKTRQEMGQNLQKEGPSVLKSLDENELLHLVHLLISKRKWVEVHSSHSSPFRLTKPVETSPSLNHSNESNGLRSLFLSQTPRPNLQKSLDRDVEKKYRSVSHTGISPPDTGRKHSSKSRADVLLDCQNLVKEVLREHPGGFNMGSFPKLFLERYNYPLDLQKLGYQKLTSLMKIMFGVKVESNYMFPCPSVVVTGLPDSDNANSGHAMASADNAVSESGKNDDNNDSRWEELGPISNTRSSRSEEELRSKGDAFGLWGILEEHDYESPLSEDDSSDSDAKTSSATRSETQRQFKFKNETCSLLEVLDSWQNQKEVDQSKTQCKHVDSTLDLSSGVSATSTGKYSQNLRPQKRYTFLSNTFTTDNDKQMDVSLGCSRNSDESSLRNS